jgi:hypothetical protein
MHTENRERESVCVSVCVCVCVCVCVLHLFSIQQLLLIQFEAFFLFFYCWESHPPFIVDDDGHGNIPFPKTFHSL